MAGLEIGQDTVLFVEKRQVVRRHDTDVEPVAAEIVGISFAAAALRVLVESDLLTVANGSGRGGDDARRSPNVEHEDRSAGHVKPVSVRRASGYPSHRRVTL